MKLTRPQRSRLYGTAMLLGWILLAAMLLAKYHMTWQSQPTGSIRTDTFGLLSYLVIRTDYPGPVAVAGPTPAKQVWIWIWNWPKLALNVLLLAAGGAACWWGYRYQVNRERLVGRCDECGYDLTGIRSGKCPECGARTSA